MKKKFRCNGADRELITEGALTGVALVFLYALLTFLYVLGRSSFFIIGTMPVAERFGILVANGVSVAYSVAVFSILACLFAAPAGSIMAIATSWLLYLNRPLSNRKAGMVGGIAMLSFLGVVYIVLRSMLRERVTFEYAETFLFWFLLPAILSVAVAVAGGMKMNKKIALLH